MLNHLKREIGLWGLSANLVNIMVGAGIFALPAIIAEGLGSASIYAYLFCGLLIALVMLCFAEMSSKVTTSGGAYAYIQVAFGSYIGFVTVILFALSTIAADAAVANAIADILGSLVPIFKSQLLKTVFFLLVFSSLGYINVKGVKGSIRLVQLITILKLTPLVLLVLLSWGDVSFGNLAITTSPQWVDIGNMSLILFFAFQGAESGLSVSGEVKHPQKNIPKAIFISVVSVLILYILIQTVAQGVLGSSLALYKENTLAEVASSVVGSVGFSVIFIGAMVSMFGYLSSEVLSIPRILYRASKDKVLPVKALSNIHPRFETPAVAIIVYASLGFVFATFGGFRQLAIVSSAAMLLVYLGVCLAVIKMRINATKSSAEGFKIPGGYIVPALAIGIIGWLLSHLTQTEAYAIGVAIAGLSVLYLVKRNIYNF